MTRPRSNQKGFTIVELLMSMAVFSTIILIATVGIVMMGRRYYKGVTTARTQEAARSLEDDLSRIVQVSGNGTVNDAYSYLRNGPSPSDPEFTPTQDGYYGVRVVCLGDVRFSYVLNSPIKNDVTDTQKDITKYHALWMDRLVPGGSCLPSSISENDFAQQMPNIPGSDTTDAGKAFRRELLGNNMRLTNFKVENVGNSNQLYKINISIAYGDDELFNLDNVNPVNNTCKSISDGGQFCATAGLETYVKRRL